MNDCSHIYFISESLGTGQPNRTWEDSDLNSLIYSTNIYVFIIKVMYFFLIMNIIVSFGNHGKKIPKYKRKPIHLSFQRAMMNYC